MKNFLILFITSSIYFCNANAMEDGPSKGVFFIHDGIMYLVTPNGITTVVNGTNSFNHTSNSHSGAADSRNLENTSDTNSSSKSSDDTNKIICTHCNTKYEKDNFHVLYSCGHEFSKSCLSNRIKLFETTPSFKEFILCPRHGCGKRITLEDVNEIIPNELENLASYVETDECTMCLEQTSLINFCQLSSCGHKFCKSCIKLQVVNAKKDYLDSNSLRCAHTNCYEDLTEEDVKKSCGYKSDLVKIFNNIKLHQLAAKDPQNYKHCPTTDCSNIYKIDSDAAPTTIICQLCKKKYCSHCRRGHEQMSQAEHNDYIKHADQLIEKVGPGNAELLIETTKECPNPECDERLEKNEGCKYMKCRGCQTLFCWNCLKMFGKLGEHAVVPHDCKN